MGIILGDDNAVNELGNNRNNDAARAANNVDEHGMVIPPNMRNYQEKTILGGLVKLKKCDICDLFWGRIKDVERDLVRSHFFIVALTSIILFEILIGTDYKN